MSRPLTDIPEPPADSGIELRPSVGAAIAEPDPGPESKPLPLPLPHLHTDQAAGLHAPEPHTAGPHAAQSHAAEPPLIIPASRAQRLNQLQQPPRGRTARTRLVVLLAIACAAAIVGFVVLSDRQTTLTQAHATVARTAAQLEAAATRGAHKGYPGVPAMIRASTYLQDRAGYDAFAIVDSTGREFGLNAHRTYVSASVTKSMLLVAYVRALGEEHESLGPESEKLLYPMVHVSDNTAATTVWHRVGDDGLTDVAHAAGMRDFSFGANWANESMSPADMARFFYRMDSLIPRQFRGYARRLLSGIDPTESWGVPAAARPRHWQVYFKGGWRLTGDGQLVSQVGRLERHHRRIAIAVMTVEDPSMGYGEETIAGVTSRLVGR